MNLLFQCIATNKCIILKAEKSNRKTEIYAMSDSLSSKVLEKAAFSFSFFLLIGAITVIYLDAEAIAKRCM